MPSKTTKNSIIIYTIVLIFCVACATNTNHLPINDRGISPTKQADDIINSENNISNREKILNTQISEADKLCFNISGRFSLTFLKKSKREQGNLEWKRCLAGFKDGENGETERLVIKSSLGIQIAELRISEIGAKLYANSKVFQDTKADDLLAKVINLPLPFSKLSTWLQNRSQQKSNNGNISVLYDSPWVINFEYPTKEQSEADVFPDFINITDQENIQLLIRVNFYIVW